MLGPTRSFAKALLGSVGEVTAEQMDKNKGKYQVGDVVGASEATRHPSRRRRPPGDDVDNLLLQIHVCRAWVEREYLRNALNQRNTTMKMPRLAEATTALRQLVVETEMEAEKLVGEIAAAGEHRTTVMTKGREKVRQVREGVTDFSGYQSPDATVLVGDFFVPDAVFERSPTKVIRMDDPAAMGH